MPMNRSLIGRMTSFWFRPVSAAGFGMMRVAFGVIAFVTMLLEMPNVQRFYGPTGILSHDMIEKVLRTSWRFSLLDYAGTMGVWLLYAIFLVSLFCVIVGFGRKWMLLVAVVLLSSFHEYGTITLDGGDTLLRLLGFILLLSPCFRTFTIANLRTRLKLIRETGKDQPPSKRTMPIWPYRLLLWQMILIYVSSAIGKWHGSMWRDGSAVAAILHLTDFTRLSPKMADALSFMSPVVGYFTVFSQLAWGLLLILGLLSFFGILTSEASNIFKRTLLLCGILLHGSIFMFMDIGTFSLTVFAAYLGLLLDDDFRAIRVRFNARMKAPLVVLFDGRCGFCKKSIFTLSMLDWLHRVEFANYHDPHNKKSYAPAVSMDALNKEMHVKLADGTYKKGFFAFRALTWHLPVLFILAPFLYIPGVSYIGTRIYMWVAEHRPITASYIP